MESAQHTDKQGQQHETGTAMQSRANDSTGFVRCSQHNVDKSWTCSGAAGPSCGTHSIIYRSVQRMSVMMPALYNRVINLVIESEDLLLLMQCFRIICYMHAHKPLSATILCRRMIRRISQCRAHCRQGRQHHCCPQPMLLQRWSQQAAHSARPSSERTGRTRSQRCG